MKFRIIPMVILFILLASSAQLGQQVSPSDSTIPSLDTVSFSNSASNGNGIDSVFLYASLSALGEYTAGQRAPLKGQTGNIYRLAVDSKLWSQWSLQYPVTYVFELTDIKDLNVWRCEQFEFSL
jgi:hypothetical protein